MSDFDWSSPVFWGCLAAILLIAEMLSGTFALVFFSASAGLVALASFMGFRDPIGQLLIFTVFGIGGLFFLRQRIKESLGKDSAPAFNIDAQKEIILSASIPARGEATISYQGTSWTAINDSDTPLIAGQKAVIVKAAGIKLHVQPQNGASHV